MLSDAFHVESQVQAYHGRSTVSRDALALGQGGRVVDCEVTCNRPFGSADRIGGLVELGRHVEVVNRGLTAVDTVKTDERVDLEVGKVEVDIDGVETNEEIDKSGLFLGGNMLQKMGGELVARGERLANEDI